MEEQHFDVIIIRGAPASGKSQTAKSLSKYYPSGVRLEVDTLRQMVISVDWTNQREHINMLQATSSLVCDFIGFGFSPIIVVDTFSGDKVDKFVESICQSNKSLSCTIIGLFTTDRELKRRLALRSKDQFVDFDICKQINDDVIKIKSESEFQIDTTDLEATQTAEIIYSYVIENQNVTG
jgi:broad-specificity NMP kinase